METTISKKVRVTGQADVKQVSNYKTNVLEVNAAMKVDKPSFAGALKMLNVLLPTDAPRHIGIMVRASLKDDAKFLSLKTATKCSKSGKYSPFAILQAIHRLNK